MNRCPDCNKKLRGDANNCPRCGWKKPKYIFPFFQEKTVTGHCPHCGRAFYNDETKCRSCGWKRKSYRAGFGLLLFSFLLPLFGIIYGDIMKYVAPRKALACRVVSTISLFILLTAIVFWLL